MNAVTARVIEGAIAVHRALGPGLLEAAYPACLGYELHEAGLHVEPQRPVPFIYKGVKMDCAYRVDLFVEASVLVEVKALEALAPIHSRQMGTYLRLLGAPVGLMLNFGAKTMREGITRIVNDFPDRERPCIAENAEARRPPGG